MSLESRIEELEKRLSQVENENAKLKGALFLDQHVTQTERLDKIYDHVDLMTDAANRALVEVDLVYSLLEAYVQPGDLEEFWRDIGDILESRRDMHKGARDWLKEKHQRLYRILQELDRL